VLIKADYAQIELRLIAEIAGDDAMKKAFIDGVDLHALTATHVNGGGAIEDVTTDDRQMAKAVNFGLIYGMGAPRLADYARSSYGVDMDEATASEVRASYFRAYPGLRRWQRLQGRLKETRTVSGRRRAFEGDGHYTGKLNSPVQGTGADGLKLALIRLWETRDTVDAYPVLTVHDEIVVEAPADIHEDGDHGLRPQVDGARKAHVERGDAEGDEIHEKAARERGDPPGDGFGGEVIRPHREVLAVLLDAADR